MDFADEQSVVQSRWATSALGLLRTQFGTDLKELAKQAEIALAEDLGELTQMDEITYIGSGWTIGLALEAALKTREAAQFWAEAYPAMDYRHGPLSISQPGRAVWAFGKRTMAKMVRFPFHNLDARYGHLARSSLLSSPTYFELARLLNRAP